MVLQTLFALYSIVPAGGLTGDPADPMVRDPFTVHSTTSIVDASLLWAMSAEVFMPQPDASRTRYPGAVIVATDKTRDRAFLLGGRMAEIGVTVIMYTHEEYATHRLRVFDARAAVDSMRRRTDVRPEEVGIIAFDEASVVVPDIVGDTTLNFAIVATSKESVPTLAKRYSRARAATLLVQGIENLDYGGIPLSNAVTQGADIPPMFVPPPVLKVKELPAGEVDKIFRQYAAPNVTVWPVPREQLEAIGEAHSTLGNRVVGWVKEQVHARPGALQLSAFSQ